jgi:trimeric autotransporter adhesin
LTITIVANQIGVVDAERDAGAAEITMGDGFTINAGTANISLDLEDGTGNTNTTSGNITIENLTTTGHVEIINDGLTAGSSILRASADSLITASSVAMDLDPVTGISGSIGTSAAPIRVMVTNLDAHTHFGNSGIFIDSLQSLIIGGSFFGSGFAVKGVQTSATDMTGGDIEITVAGNLTTAGSSTGLIQAQGTTGNIDIQATGNITINDILSTGTGSSGTLSVDADSDNNATGTFTIGASGSLVDAGTGGVSITAADLDIISGGTIIMGAGQLFLQTSTTVTMGIGAATCGGTCGMTISGAEFQRITATDIQFLTTGGAELFIDSLTGTNTANSTGLVQFNSTGDITVSGSTLTFNMAGNGFANGINIHAQSGTLNLNTGVTVTTGGLVLRGQTGVSIASGLTFTAGDAMFLQRLTGSGNITVAGAATFNAGNGITVDENLNASGDLIFNADSDNNGTGDFAISAGEMLTTNNNNLNITAADFNLNITGVINAGTAGDVTILVSNGGVINVGATTGSMQIDDTELNNIMAANLNIGDSSTGNIFVHGLTGNSSIATLTLTTGSISTIFFSSGASIVSNNLVVVAGADISGPAGLTVSGTTSFTVTGTNVITMNNAANNFAGAVTLSSGTGLVSVVDTNNLTIAASTLGGALTLVSGGNITQTGALSVAGVSTITATAGNITLTNSSNLFTGSLTINNSGTGATQLTNTTNTVLGVSTIGSGGLTLISSGNITQ